MPARRLNVHQELAHLGAIARLDQIEQERLAILKAFPNLRRKLAAAGLSPLVAQKRRTISPQGREAMSAGMRKYWARRRAAGKARAKSA